MTAEVANRALSLLAIGIAIVVAGTLAAPIVIRLVVTVAFLSLGVLLLSLGLYLLGVRWNWRRLRR